MHGLRDLTAALSMQYVDSLEIFKISQLIFLSGTVIDECSAFLASRLGLILIPIIFSTTFTAPINRGLSFGMIFPLEVWK